MWPWKLSCTRHWLMAGKSQHHACIPRPPRFLMEKPYLDSVPLGRDIGAHQRPGKRGSCLTAPSSPTRPRLSPCLAVLLPSQFAGGGAFPTPWLVRASCAPPSQSESNLELYLHSRRRCASPLPFLPWPSAPNGLLFPSSFQALVVRHFEIYMPNKARSLFI
ncbi:hypothetical protein BJ166DRAFT_363147 [Pestalotiopsis sp. NC0098]|nr:hypothetical protein BJ166DRAFT_363147 [Pestalotiopsis sp. NC0098]